MVYGSRPLTGPPDADRVTPRPPQKKKKLIMIIKQLYHATQR
jgi:hypothetical protein